jgi:hypothetical protein
MAAVSIIPRPPWANAEDTEKSARTTIVQAMIPKRAIRPLAEGRTLDVCGRFAIFLAANLPHNLLRFMIRHFNDRWSTKFVLKTRAAMRFYVDGNSKFSLSVNGCFFGVNIDLLALIPPGPSIKNL